MRAFLSYASEHRDLAIRLDLGLRNLGVETFFDRNALPPGETFDDRIAAAIARAHLFIFLISHEAVAKGAYTLTELGQAQKRWPHPSGTVLPVFIERVAVEQLPPYLRAVSILDPSGEPVADTLNAVAELVALRRNRKRNRILAGAAGAMLVAGGLWAVYVTGPALLGDRIGRALHPPVVENVQVGQDLIATEADALRFDVTLYTPSPDAVTTVSLAPVTDRSDVTFGSSAEAFFAINRGDRRSLTIRATLNSPASATAFQWRICWEYVRTEDWYAEEMYKQDGSSMKLAIFIESHKAQVCGAWRPWQPAR
ncbi:MAG: toll/interleukin-1 receptor domain-containing protein [Rubrivivax sp.]|nr:toll/interleukin-1 receptor domain-containing protein [Rubrivivax sp.]